MIGTMKRHPRKSDADNPWPARLKAIAARTGKSHQELADAVGVARGTWRAWLYGARVPGKSAAKLIHLLFPE